MVSLAIPICFVITLGRMQFFGMTLNVLSMMGLRAWSACSSTMQSWSSRASITIGNVTRTGRGIAAVQGTQVVGIAIAAGTLSSIIVFPPMVFGEKDNISIFLTQVAVAMAIAHLRVMARRGKPRADAVGETATAEVHRAQEHHHAHAGRLRQFRRAYAAPSALDDDRPRRAARDQRQCCRRRTRKSTCFRMAIAISCFSTIV